MSIFLDAVTGVQRIQLSAELHGLTTQLEAAKSANDAISKITIGAKLGDLLRRLGDDEPVGDVDVDEAQDDLSDDPNSPNYRYKDTGYIADSRKEKAASLIRDAKKNGTRLRSTDIDWTAIEQNPRQAAELVTKSNLFGRTDWQAAQDAGMDPAAGFLIDKIYASIAPEPSASSPASRKDYAIGLETIRDRLENKLAVEEVLTVLSEIKDELNGSQLSTDEAERYQLLQEEKNELGTELAGYRKSRDESYATMLTAQSRKYRAENEIRKRTDRKWKVPVDLRLEADSAAAEFEAVQKMWSDHLDVTRDPIDKAETRYRELYSEQEAIEKAARIRNIVESQCSRSWLTFGLRFFKLVHYRNNRGSDSFAGHVTNAKAGKIKDWGWADKDKPTGPRTATKQEIGFQLRVADRFERKGGKPISVSGTKALEEMIGFRAVQSGNWVLKDPNSAKFHVENTAAAMSDMADILGIDTHLLGFGGRLGMAFGARGSGGKDAAAAHYESIHRVINITKMKGGGALGHEWFHALDNVMHEMVRQEVNGGKREFTSAIPDLLPEGELREAMKSLRAAMLAGNVRSSEEIAYTGRDIQIAKHNIDRMYASGAAKVIKSAGNAEAAVLDIDKLLGGQTHKRSIKNHKSWRKIAAAYYHVGDLDRDAVASVRLKTGPATSSFAAEASRLDQGEMGKYWSRDHEMSARAFQSYLEDKLSAADRQNDYLSSYADNKYHYDPIFGIQWNPYPEGEERARINAAFDRLFEAIRKGKVFENAVGNKMLMDSIFGADGSGEEARL